MIPPDLALTLAGYREKEMKAAAEHCRQRLADRPSRQRNTLASLSGRHRRATSRRPDTSVVAQPVTTHVG